MKRLIITIVVLVLSARAMAFDFLGPPKADSGLSLGVEYIQGELNLDASGVFGLTDTEIKDVEINKIYGVFRSGVMSNLDLFVRLGVAEAEVDQGANTDNPGYFIGDSDSSFALGGGAKITFAQTAAISWGLVGQFSYVDLDFDGASGTIFGQPINLEKTEARILEFELGIGPTIEVSKGLCFYGGALFHFIDGEADLTGTVGTLSATETSDLEADSVFGGFIGGRIEFADTIDLGFEYQTTGDSYAFGINLMYRFSGPAEVKKRPVIQEIKTEPAGRKIKAYRGSRDPATGKPVIEPIYESENNQ